MEEQDKYTGLEIAVIGLAGRFPSSRNIEELWTNLRAGKELISFFSDEELREQGISEATIQNKRYVKAKGFLEDAEHFDASYFEYTDREANLMDPQIRIFHECVQEALDHAGYGGSNKPVTGLFAGAGFNPFWVANFLPDFKEFSDIFEISSLNAREYLATRVAYKLDLKGPAVTVQTACSTSLVAIHMGVQSLLAGECNMALAGGASVLFPSHDLPRKYGMMSQDGLIIAPDGHCRPFDQHGIGFMGGDGTGVVVLKRLEDATAEGDNILAVIKGSAINNDGNAKVGYTAPSIDGQSRVIKHALDIAEVDPRTVQYIETHGSGTPLGDPVEVEGLKSAYPFEGDKYCQLGSIKSNMGHTDAAAGVAGFIKTVLSISRGEVLPTVNHEVPNEKIDFENSPFTVSTATSEWPQSSGPRRAAVSSFGIGGTNAHIILEEGIRKQVDQVPAQDQLMLISAKSANSLKQQAESLETFILKEEIALTDLAYTSQVGRGSHSHRHAILFENQEELLASLKQEELEKKSIFLKQEESRSIVFAFQGLGGQYVNMGRDLYDQYPVFHDKMDEGFSIVKEISNISLKDIIYPTAGAEDQAAKQLQEFEAAQLATFTFECALAELLMSLGIKPDALLGYSFGELVALHVGKGLSFRQALYFVVERGKVVSSSLPGRMLSVPLSVEEVKPRLLLQAEIAIDNGDSCVVSGPLQVIDQLEEKLRADRILSMPIAGNFALHSSMMSPLLPQMRDVLETLSIDALEVPMASNLTGEWINDEVTDPAYWERQLNQTVQFAKSLEQVLQLPNATIIEIGPGADLIATIKRHTQKEKKHEALNLIRPESMNISDERFLLGRIRRLWLLGLHINWEVLHDGKQRFRIPMPGYAFDRKRYWFKDQQRKNVDAPIAAELATNTIGLSKDVNPENWLYLPSWEKSHSEEVANFDGLYQWLIFSDGSEEAALAIEALVKGSQKVVQVTIGRKFEQLDLTSFKLNPAVETQYQLLFNHLNAHDLLPERIIHWWNVDTKNNLSDHTQAAAEQGYFSLVNTALALHRLDGGREHIVFNITKNIHSIYGDEAINPLATLSLGASKVIPIEFDHIKCINLDFDSANTQLSLSLVNELKSPDLSELMVAFRGKTKWTQTFRQEKIQSEDREVQRILGGKKVFLIVGGLTTRSNLGYLFAKYFAEKGTHEIVFLSRTQFPAREKWSEIDNQHGLFLKTKQIQELELLGVNIHTYVGDLTQFESFQATVGQIEKDLGKISGVINVAGIMTGDSMDLIINQVPKTTIQQQFDIKVQGTINLFEAFKGRSLDFCVFSSSLTSVMGPFSSYSAGNNFMDAFTYWVQDQVQGRWLTINWDHLLGFSDQQEDQPLAINHEEIIASFERILSGSTHNQVLLSTTSIDARIKGTYRVNTLPSIRKKSIDKWYYQPVWELVKLAGKQIEKPKNILIVGQEKIAKKLEKPYQSQGASTWLINEISNEKSLSESLKAYRTQDVNWDEVHFIWSQIESGEITEAYYALLTFLKTWITENPDVTLQLRLVVDQSFMIHAQQGQNPELASLLGPASIIGLENPLIKVQYLDVLLADVIKQPEQLLSLPTGLDHSILALRGEKWYTREFKPSVLPEPISMDQTIKEEGFYLVTGGLGGMALELVKTFGNHTSANFLLIDNQDFPERSDWTSLVNNESEDQTIREKVQTLVDLEMQGVGIMIQTVDICDQKSVNQAFEAGAQQYGKLNGLFHIAGSIDKAGIIQRRSLDFPDKVLEAKVTGAKNLEVILEKHPVDFAMYFSSTGNIFTRLKFGQASYNAGHEYLDAYVYQLREKGIKAYSVNFNDWQETGIAAEATAYEIKGQQLSFEDLLSVKPAEGLHALLTILANDEPRVAISAYGIDQISDFIDQIDFSDVSSLDDKKSQSGERPDLESPYVEPANETERILVEVFQTTFGYVVGVEDDFFELGGDSIKAIAAISALQLKHQLDIPITTFFELRTARNIAVFLGESEVSDILEVEQPVSQSDDFYEPFPVSPMQMAYIIGKGEHFEMGGISSNVYQETTLEVDPVRLSEAFNLIMNRHPMLKVVMLPDGTQQFHRVEKYNMPVTDLRSLTEEERQQALNNEQQRLRTKVFDEQKWPLFEVTLMRLTDQKSHMFFCLDHLVGDAASIMVLVKDWGAALNESEVALPPIDYTYKDYIGDFMSHRSGAKFEQSKKYWLDQLDDFPSAPELPFVADPTSIKKPMFGRKRRLFDKSEWQLIQAAAKKLDSTPSVVFCTAYSEVLSVWSNSPELALNLTMFNRYPFHEDIDKLVGDFTTLVMLGLHPGKHTSFEEKVKHTRSQLLKSLDHRFYDGLDFIRELRRHRGLGTSAIMPYVFTSALFLDDSTSAAQEDIFGFWSDQRDEGQSSSTTSQVYIDCTVSELNGGLELVWDYVPEIFDKQVIQTMFDHMVQLLEAVMVGQTIPYLEPPAIQLQAYQQFNETAAVLPNYSTVIDRFESIAHDRPSEVALKFEGKKLTYQAFNVQVNQLARKLQHEGVTKGDVLAVHISRSLEMMVAIYAVMKTGGVYLPIPTSLPKDRIQYILSDAKAAAVLVKEIQVEGIKCIDIADESRESYDEENLRVDLSGDDPAYLIYTSGSTGQPKGVLVQHLPLVNRLAWMQDAYPITSDDRLLQKTPIGFDVSLWELFWWGQEAAALQLLPIDQEKSPDLLLEQIIQGKVTVIHFVPSMFELFLSEVEQQKARVHLKQLKYIFCSGEALHLVHVDRFNKLFVDLPCRLINLYGPTEATIDVSHVDCTGRQFSGIVPIGKPIDNIELFVLNNQMQPVPHGVSGELYIGGIGLAHSYLNQSELTKPSFIDFKIGTSKRVYKTGDLVKYANGELYYVDRIDDQVKVRGNRIELNEITYHLSNLTGIDAAVTIIRDDMDRGKYLCAYLVGHEMEVGEIRAQLMTYLPDYMVPAYYEFLSEIPLTPNGKLNRRSLPAPGAKERPTETLRLPETESEKALVHIWTENLKVNELSIQDNYFDLGGDSFHGTLLVSAIEKELGVKVSLAQLFKTPTIQGLAASLSRASIHRGVEKAPLLDRYPLSAQQTRMFVLHQIAPQVTNYNLSTIKEVQGDLDRSAMEHAFQQIVASHEVFRTSFHEENGAYYQLVHEKTPFSIAYVETSTTTLDKHIKEAIRPFDLQEAPLLRVTIIKASDDTHYLILDMHHIVSDILSITILINDLNQAYEGQSLNVAPLQYKDYSYWQSEGAISDSTKSYWLEQLRGELPVAKLPIDFSRPSKPTYEAGRHSLKISNELLKKFEVNAQEQGATLQMSLMASCFIFLHKICDQEDIVIGTPVLDARPSGLEHVMGIFLNTLAVRSQIDPLKGFNALLQEVKDKMIDHFDHMDLPFEALVELLEIDRNVTRNPVFDVMFVYQTQDDSELKVGDLLLKDFPILRANANFDLTIYCVKGDESLDVVFDYKSQLFRPASIERLGRSFVKLMEQIAENDSTAIEQLDVVSEEDKITLNEFNSTEKDFGYSSVVDIMEGQASDIPTRTAIYYKNEVCPYGELAERSARVATYLQHSCQVVKGDVVAYFAEKDEWTLPVIYGIMKAGGVYMPLSVDFPKERIGGILEESQPKVIVTNSHRKAGFMNLSAKVVSSEDFDSDPKLFNPTELTSTDLAYIIYTSGSTGKPKGAMISHGALFNRLAWMQDAYPISQDDVLIQKTPLSFDVSIWELFWWSFAGAQLVILEQGFEKEPNKLIECIQRHQVTTIHFVPSMLATFTGYLIEEANQIALNSLQRIFASGEALTPTHVQEVAKVLTRENQSLQLINLYGPTEATVDVTHFACSFESELHLVPIGKPISNIKCHVMNSAGKLNSIGQPGELCLSGIGLAEGYLNNDQLTDKSFVYSQELGERIYKTGDLVRWMPDGNLEFQGRLDDQVKLRGYRIELGEISHHLSQHSGIEQGLVMSRGRGEDQQLVAYYRGDQLESSEISSYLLEKLPAYMVPQSFVHLQHFPLTTNGKVNRNALPEPQTLQEAYTAPKGEIAERLTTIWAEVLDLDELEISATQSFFSLGGNSLKAITLISKVNKIFGVKVPFVELFNYQTVQSLAEFIELSGWLSPENATTEGERQKVLI